MEEDWAAGWAADLEEATVVGLAEDLVEVTEADLVEAMVAGLAADLVEVMEVDYLELKDRISQDKINE